MNAWMTWLAERVAHAVGRPPALVIAIMVIPALYGVAGLDITNIAISVVSLLLLLLLQATQNRDGAAIQAKLDEIIRAGDARDEFIGVDHMTEEEVRRMRER